MSCKKGLYTCHVCMVLLCITFIFSSYNILGGYVYEAEILYGTGPDGSAGSDFTALCHYIAVE